MPNRCTQAYPTFVCCQLMKQCMTMRYHSLLKSWNISKRAIAIAKPATPSVATQLLILTPIKSFIVPKIGAAKAAVRTATKLDLQKEWFLSRAREHV